MAGNRPTHRAYTVRDRGDDEEAFWVRIGSAFGHKDKQGFNIVLDALPVDGRIVLREFTDEDNEDEEPKKKTARPRKKRAA